MKSLSLNKPHAIIMVGIPGSGKSFFASKFAQTFSAPYIDELAIQRYAKNDEAAIHLVEMMIEQATRTGKTVVLEVESTDRNHRTALAKALKDVGYVPLFVWVQTDDATARTRSIKAASLSAAGFADALEAFSAPHPQENALVISGKHTYATQAKVVLKRLTDKRTTKLEPLPRPVPTRGNITVR